MTKVMGLDFAPLNIPFERRLQTLAVIHYVMIFLILPVFCLLGTFFLLFSQYWWCVALYGIWFVYDLDTPRKGGRAAHFFRNSPIWRYFRDYFPISLHKTVDLDPNRNYIFGYHPHGIMCIGAYSNFATTATGFSKMFPGIRATLVTLVGQYYFPIRREYTMMSGVCDVSKDSIRYILNREEKGQAVVIVVGGAAEALDAHPGRYNVLLSRRKGFIKLAIQQGADVVPVFSFGENDLYLQMDNPDGSGLRKFQNWFKNYAGFSPPVIHGRGVFNYTWGILPFRRPIDTVVGKPVPVTKNPTPSQEEIDRVHGEYIDGLKQLFEDNKARFGVPSDAHIKIF